MHWLEERWGLKQGAGFPENGAGKHTSTGAFRNGKA